MLYNPELTKQQEETVSKLATFAWEPFGELLVLRLSSPDAAEAEALLTTLFADQPFSLSKNHGVYDFYKANGSVFTAGSLQRQDIPYLAIHPQNKWLYYDLVSENSSIKLPTPMRPKLQNNAI